MATAPKDGKLIYHITSLDNLASIFANGLMPRNAVSNFNDVADAEIVDHREEHNLNGFIPFHFMGSSPFAGAIQSAYPNTEFVYITLKRETAKGNKFKILPKHPLALVDCKLYEYEEGMKLIDWELMNERNYKDRNCKNVCMAECLCDKRILHTAFSSIFCKSEETKREIIRIMKNETGDTPNFHINVNTFLFK